MSNLVEHAKRELALMDNDDKFNESIIKAVEAFASYGHSGGSASAGIAILYDLLQFKNLMPLTNDRAEWMCVDREGNIWQSTRNSEAFSNNRGKTYYLLSEGANFENPHPQHATAQA